MLSAITPRGKQSVPVDVVLAHYAEYSPTQHFAKRIGKYPEWSLARIKVAHLEVDQAVQSDTVDQYAAWVTEPPPIIAVPTDLKWEVLDGNHRAAAAQAQGKRTILAYVPAKSVLALEARRSRVGLRGVSQRASFMRVPGGR